MSIETPRILTLISTRFLVRAKYEHQIREVEYAKKKREGELEEELEVIRGKLRHEEKTNAELKEELENKENDHAQEQTVNYFLSIQISNAMYIY